MDNYEKVQTPFRFKKLTNDPAVDIVVHQPTHGSIGVVGKTKVCYIPPGSYTIVVIRHIAFCVDLGLPQRSGFLSDKDLSSLLPQRSNTERWKDKA